MQKKNFNEITEKQFPERQCAVCGKKFIVMSARLWAYKIRTSDKVAPKYYCSYSCYRKAGGDSGKFRHYEYRNR